MAIPLLRNDSLLLIREYCAGTHSYELVFPTGSVEPDERLEDAVQRELREEIGYAANQLSRVAVLKVSPGHTDHKTYVFLAKNLYAASLVGDEPELPEIVEWPLTDVDELIESGQVSEARSIAALLLLQRALCQP